MSDYMRYNKLLTTDAEDQVLETYTQEESTLLKHAGEQYKAGNFEVFYQLKKQVDQIRAERQRYIEYLAVKYPK